jgi:hypothetical protein
MKKSHAITLTVVAAMGMAGRAQQTQPPVVQPSTSLTCEERVRAAQAAGGQATENCGHGSGAYGSHRGGFGATGRSHTGGG